MYEYSCTVRRVVDGDTVDVDIDLGFDIVLSNQRIRLYGIDTPESRTRDLTEKTYGKAASRFLETALGSGRVTLRTHLDGRGKFGRILGEFIVYDSDTDSYRSVNKIMVEKHLATEYYGQSKDEIEEQHIKNRELVDPIYLWES
jgi:micrococcal nuclease